MKRPSVSVVIPAYNAEHTVEAALRSVLSQSFPPEEVIVVDDGSTDGTVSVIKRIARADRRVKCICQENAGPSAARNRGIVSSKGDYIAFCDADDQWHTEKLARQIPFLESNRSCAMIGSRTGAVQLPSPGRVTPVSFLHLLFKNEFVTSTVLMRRDAAFTGFNPSQRYSEDYRLWLFVARDNGAAVCDESLAVYGGGKRGFGSSGLSAKLWQMEKGELSNYLYCFTTGLLPGRTAGGFLLFLLLCFWSLAKFVRRSLVSSLRPSGKNGCVNRTVLFVGNTSFSMYNFRLGVMRALRDKGYTVIVAAPRDRYSALFEKESIAFKEIVMSRKGINPLREIRTVIVLYYLYREIRPSLVFNYTIKPIIYGSVAAAFARVKSIAVTTGLGYAFVSENRFAPAALAARFLYRIALLFPGEVWFLNAEDRDIFVSGNIVSAKKASVIPGEGIDTSHFSPRAVKAAKKISFLLIARIVADKGVRDFIEASRLLLAKKIKVECLLLGSFDDYPNAITKKEVAQWESQGLVRYLGVTHDVRSAIAGADCIVLPSAYREGVPRSLMEGAAMEKPLIATDIAGCRDVVRDGINGFLCQPRNPESLAAAMEKFCALPAAARRALGKNGRKLIRDEFDEKIIASLYLSAVNRRTQG